MTARMGGLRVRPENISGSLFSKDAPNQPHPVRAFRRHSRTVALGFGSFSFGLGGRGFGRRWDGLVHPFQDGLLGGVAAAQPQPYDARIASVPLFVRGRNFVEQQFDGIFLVEARCGQAPMVDGAAFAQGDHFFGYGTGCFGLGEGGGDAAVFDEAANQVGQHRIAVLAGAA